MAMTRTVTLRELFNRHQMAGKVLEEKLALRGQAKLLEQEAVKANDEADEISSMLETPR